MAEEIPGPISAALRNVTELPSALIDDVCFGIASLPDIFVKHGFTAESAEIFRDNEVFRRVVALRTAELDKEGLTHKVRATMVADSALTELAKRVRDPNTSTGILLDTYKAVAKNAGLEPKGPDANTGVPPFTINFILPNQAQPAQRVIDATPETHPTATVYFNPAEYEIVE